MIKDKGHWSVVVGSNRPFGHLTAQIYLQSDDFTHDVMLKIDGDFTNSDEKMEYARYLADRLNGTRPTP